MATSSPEFSNAASHLSDLLSTIKQRLEACDPHAPQFINAEIPPRPGVTTTAWVLEQTGPFALIERAGLVLTHVEKRPMPQNMIKGMFEQQGKPDDGVGVPPAGSMFTTVHLSLMVHPRSPHAPSTHANWRYFELYDSNDNRIKWWYGGAADLLPTLLYEEDCESFHRTLSNHANAHGAHTYQAMKAWCDKQFYNPFHDEVIGIGGIFYDNLSEDANEHLDLHGRNTDRPRTPAKCFDFFQCVGPAWIEGYTSILERRGRCAWTENERAAQRIRAGFITDYFTIADMGFRFGLVTGVGSLPAMRLILPEAAQWAHSHGKAGRPDKAESLVKVLAQPRNWV